MSELVHRVSPEYRNLRYLGKPRLLRDNFDLLLEKAQLAAVNLTIEGQENIPRRGAFVIGFMPHSGILEVAVIDHSMRLTGREPAVWITKIENQSLPKIVTGDRRLLYVDRSNAELEIFQLSKKILSCPNAILASALEGTRKGNPNDPKDFRTLREAEPGLMYIAISAKVPILPSIMLGTEKVIADPEDISENRGKSGVIFELVKAILTKEKPPLYVYFAPVYTAHLSIKPSGVHTQEFARQHTDMMIREEIIPKILEVDPNYPLGFYQ